MSEWASESITFTYANDNGALVIAKRNVVGTATVRHAPHALEALCMCVSVCVCVCVCVCVFVC